MNRPTMKHEPLIPSELPGVAPGRKPRILLVDDQPINIQLMHQIFAGECQLFMATSGAQALAVCESQPLDLVLLDVEMPGMDGFEVCQRLKQDERTRPIPVIFVTGHTDPALETRGLETGAVDFITKPVNPSVLRARTRTHLLLKYQSDALRELAFLDGLTSIHNRRHFDQQFTLEWARSRRHATPIALILMDVDHFKAYNDSYGHQAGDDCLREVAHIIRHSAKRETDTVARYGGEEFICLLPQTPHLAARELAHAIEERVRARALPHLGSSAAEVVSVSVGVASCQAPQGEAQALLALADEQLYRAKREGRSRVCAAELVVNRDARVTEPLTPRS